MHDADYHKKINLIWKLEESSIKKKSTSKLFKRGENLTHYKLVFFNSNTLQCTITIFYFFIQYIQIYLSKVTQTQRAEDEKIYILLDELEGQMARKHFYVLVNLTNGVMGIGQS